VCCGQMECVGVIKETLGYSIEVVVTLVTIICDATANGRDNTPNAVKERVSPSRYLDRHYERC
jgi:hypothetical protein